MSLMAEWLDAHCYETRYRPIPINEHLVCEGKVLNRPIRWSDRGWHLAADPRHSEIIIEHVGL